MIEKNMSKVFVSGCYDIIHAGHIEFFKEALKQGDKLVVCIPSDEVLYQYKKRRPSIPIEHKIEILNNISFIDEVVIGGNLDKNGLNFKDIIVKISPDVLVVTSDDKFEKSKRKFCTKHNIGYVKLEKTPPKFDPISTSSILNNIKTPNEAPLRVDLAGGWLDVPEHARDDGFIVNCAISPTVSLHNWPYETQSGLGGSGAWALLNGKDGVQSELDLGVGWQDPAVIKETGLCVWKSGKKPYLVLKRNGDMLKGKMALHYTGSSHDTPSYVKINRDYNLLARASRLAYAGVQNNNLEQLCTGISMNYEVQLKEGMDALPAIENVIATKYCGGGFGGYILSVFYNKIDRDKFINNYQHLGAIKIEPYINEI